MAISKMSAIPDESFFLCERSLLFPLSPPINLKRDEKPFTFQPHIRSSLLMIGATFGAGANFFFLENVRKSSKIISGSLLLASGGFVIAKCCNLDSNNTVYATLIGGALGDFVYSSWFKTTPYLLVTAAFITTTAELINMMFPLPEHEFLLNEKKRALKTI